MPPGLSALDVTPELTGSCQLEGEAKILAFVIVDGCPMRFIFISFLSDVFFRSCALPPTTRVSCNCLPSSRVNVVTVSKKIPVELGQRG